MRLRDEGGQVMLSLFLLMVLTSMIIGGVYMIDRFGLLDVQEQVYRYLGDVPVLGSYLVESPVSLAERQQAELRRLSDRLDRQETNLQKRRQELKERREELQQKRRQLDRQQETLQQREQALAERRARFDDDETRYQYLANLYSNMRPADAAARLGNVDQDRIIIEVFRRMENRSTSIILSNMDDQRAAVLTRKMANYPR
jgi:flagellar motility protein MotE (MotC chaperone)